MKTSRSRLIAGRSLGLVLSGLMLGHPGIAAAQSQMVSTQEGSQRLAPALIVGTWRVTVTVKDCQTGNPLGNPFHSLLTFASGGTLTGTTSNPAFQRGQRTADYGVWIPIAEGSYSALSEALIGFSAGMFTAGSQVISHHINLAKGGAAFTDDAKVQYYDSNNTLLISGCAAASATRLQ